MLLSCNRLDKKTEKTDFDLCVKYNSKKVADFKEFVKQYRSQVKIIDNLVLRGV